MKKQEQKILKVWKHIWEENYSWKRIQEKIMKSKL